MSRLVVCISGYPGSGKSIFANTARELGIPIYTMGDVVREEARRIYGRIDPETVAKTSQEIRRRMGRGAVARLLAQKIDSSNHEIVVVDGVRSPDEIEALSTIGRTVIITLIASRRTRFERLIKRGRIDDKPTYENLLEREERERSFGLDKVIEAANLYIYNEDISLEELKSIAKNLFQEISGVGRDEEKRENRTVQREG